MRGAAARRRSVDADLLQFCYACVAIDHDAYADNVFNVSPDHCQPSFDVSMAPTAMIQLCDYSGDLAPTPSGTNSGLQHLPLSAGAGAFPSLCWRKFLGRAAPARGQTIRDITPWSLWSAAINARSLPVTANTSAVTTINGRPPLSTLPTAEQTVADRRGEKIDFQLGGQHFFVFGQLRKRGVAGVLCRPARSPARRRRPLAVGGLTPWIAARRQCRFHSRRPPRPESTRQVVRIIRLRRQALFDALPAGFQPVRRWV